MKDVKLRYIDIDNQDCVDALIGEALYGLSVKDKLLAALGIERREGESHLGAWVQAMMEENTLENKEDVARAIDACPDASAIWRFVWVIA